MKSQASQWRAYSETQVVQEFLKSSNDEFQALARPNDLISERDVDWKKMVSAKESIFYFQLMENNLSEDLKSKIRRFKQDYGFPLVAEVFVTNKFGANVAQTNITSDYRQNDEQWWQNAQASGIYISDVALDQSANVYSSDICIAIHDSSGGFLGVMKVVLNVQEIEVLIKDQSSALAQYAENTITLANSSKRVIYSSKQSSHNFVTQANHLAGAPGRALWSFVDGQHTLSLLRSAEDSSSQLFGLNWQVLIELDAESLLAIAKRVRTQILFTTLLVALLLVVPGVLFSMSLRERFKKLEKTAIEFANGNMQARAGLTGSDELADLGQTVDAMLSDIEQLTLKLEATRDKALEADKVKSQFLANMSREIRTPMNGVLGMIDLLLDTELKAEQIDLANTAKESASSLLGIINDILDFSKIESGKFLLSPEVFNLHSVLKSQEKLHAAKLAEKGIIFVCKIGESVPEMVEGDTIRLNQVLTNLISNALKFTPENGGVTLTASLKEKKEQTVQIEFVVMDTGIGIEAENQQRIFNPFEQEDPSTTRKFGGTGLGLAICKQIADLMGGQLEVVSKPGAGSVFIFTALLKEIEQKAVPEESTVRQESRQSEKGLRVLLAEDNLINQKLAVALLKKVGHSVVVAENGQQAVNLVQEEEFDLVLMDIQMPVMSGEEATLAIRRSQNSIPIVALTANAMAGDKERYLSLGMDGYLAKPLDRRQLYSLLEHFASQ